MLELLGFSILLLGTVSGADTGNCSATCLQDPNNATKSCNVTSGECLYGCVQGYFGQNCSECSANCASSPTNNSNVCDSTTRNCSFGCKQSYAGPICSFECPPNCGLVPELGKETCNVTSDECSFGCQPGYAGPKCSTVCPTNCSASAESNTETCNDTSGECLHGCNPGFAGPTCSYKCPGNCRISTDIKLETCNESTSKCLLGCQYGYAGPNCTFECPGNCGLSDDLFSQTCNKTSMNCLFGCTQGYGGSNCSYECPTTCLQPLTNNTETCNETTGACFLGCASGYAGSDCSYECPGNCSHADNNSDTCDYISGQCLHGCLPGLAGTNCSFICPSNCMLPVENGTETCNYTTSECLHGCQPGYAGPNCSFICPSNCMLPMENETETCTFSTGECSVGCKSGYAGPNCSFECPGNCSHAENHSDTCDYISGQCLHGCRPGLAGPYCSFICPSNCMLPVENGTETCNYTTWACLHGCQSGYAGPNCSVECPQTCSSSNITGVEICNATSEECIYGCKDGFYGTRCEKKCYDVDTKCKRCSLTITNSVVCLECSTNNHYIETGKCMECNYWCAVNVTSPLPKCEVDDGYCNFGCKAGRYGYKCGRQCRSTCNDTCHRDTGTCLTGCKFPSYCGPTCEIPCNDGCTSQQCNQSCSCSVGCNPKRWGEKCDKFCNVNNCKTPPDHDSNICDRSNGSCLYKCDNDKYWGSQCEQSCSSDCIGEVCEQVTGNCTKGCNSTKVYGIRCDMKCDEDCINGTCERADGSCDIGCITGSYGNRCDTKCSENCLDHTCGRANGYCDYGCNAGSYGNFCEAQCSDNCLKQTCERQSGDCTSCESGYEGPKCDNVLPPDSYWIYVAIGCGALVLLGVLVTIVLVTKKRRVIARRKRADRMSKIPDEKFLEEAQMRHRRKGEGAGARLTQLFVENPLARFMKYRSHAGALITKIPLDELLRKVKKMDENDYGREFDEFTVGLTKSYEVSRKLDNLSLNFFNGIYPYDENRVILRHSFEDDTRKSKGKRGILKSVHFVTFRPSRDNRDYETLEAGNNESSSFGGGEQRTKTTTSALKSHGVNDGSNGYASVVFDIHDESIPSQNQEEGISDDYATVEVCQGNAASSNTADNNLSCGDAKESAEGKMEISEADQSADAFSDSAQVDKDTKATKPTSNEQVNDQSFEYAHVNKEGKTKQSTLEQTENDEPYAIVHKEKKADADTRINKQAEIKDGSVVIRKDYINASLIKGHNLNEKYIAAQAPSKLTANDFWLMVWEQKSQFVIMLTVIPEDGYSRCEKYWPDQGNEETFEDIKVTCEVVKEYADYMIRTLKLSLKNGHERDVIHMQFTSWPDEGCPVSAIEFIEFHQKYRSMTKGRHAVGPSIVHCTAGIGRTGVFIALDILVEEGLDSLSVDVFKCVTALREQRVDMVHSIDQYEFLYKSLAQTFALECQPYHKLRLQEKLAELKKFDHNSGKTKLEVLYNNIKDSLGLDTAEIASLDVVQEKKIKDRPKSDVPDVLFRAGLPHNVYINAVVFESSRNREAMVATQMPTPGTVQDFCQLLIHHQCATVIMLNNIDPNDKSIGVYWPTEKTPFVAGKTIITQLHVEKQSDYIIRQLRLHNPEFSDEDNPTQAITMIQYKGWKIVKNVPNAKNLLKLLQLCQRYIKDTPDKRLLVHCMDGAEQSGLFCALVNLLELADTEDEISVPIVVRKILARRPNAIPSVDQFEMCFSTTCEYIRKQDNV